MGTCAYAQATGSLRLFITPDAGMSFVLDGKYRLNDRELTLSEGPHRFVFWAPERIMLDTTVHIKGGVQQEFHVHLFHSIETINHREAMHRYERARRWGRTLPPVVMAGAAAWTVVAYVNWGARHRQLQELEESYRSLSSPLRLAELKATEIPEAKNAFNKARTMTYAGAGVFVLSAAATVWYRHRLARMAPPVFQDKERIRFEGLVMHADPATGRGIWAAGLSIPIQ